jgi:hypothetical protein
MSSPTAPIIATNVTVEVQNTPETLVATTDTSEDVSILGGMLDIEIQNVLGSIEIQEIDAEAGIVRTDPEVTLVETTGDLVSFSTVIQETQLLHSDPEVQFVDSTTEQLQVFYTGAQGPPGPSNSGNDTFTYQASSASTQWVITHNLDRYPSVTIVDSAGTQFWADVTYTSLNTIEVNFAFPMSGYAYLN